MKFTAIVASILLALTLTLPFTTGCAGTTPAKAAVNVSDSAKITVESALRAWDAYIVQYRPSLEKQRAVKNAYNKYKSAQITVLDAAILVKTTTGNADVETKLNAAITDAGVALADLVNLLRTYGVKI